MKNIKTLQNQIDKIKAKLLTIGDMHPGSLTKQYNICGAASCRCKDPDNPKKHGPYYQLSYVHNGKSTSRFIKQNYVTEMKKQINNYKLFKKIMRDWTNLATSLAQLKADLAKKSEQNS